MYRAAKILYNHINNNAKLAICLVRLEQYQEAVDAARKANAIQTWKEVCFACVDAGHFRLAQICGVQIIVFHEHLMDLCKHYERLAHFDELIALLEQGILLDRAHQGLYTQLGVLYCKYKEEKVMEHIRLFVTRVNIPTLIGACRKNLLWSEAVFLYTHYDQPDNAVDVMIEHPFSWNHKQFKEVLSSVPNNEYFYKSIDFYLSEHPLQLTDLLLDMASKLDHSRVVLQLKRAGHLPLIEKYLLHVQHDNLTAVNEAINELCVLEEKYKQLRISIDSYDHFDQIALAQQVEKHELLEFRRISAYLFKLNKRFDKSIELSKLDSLWQDAMETAAESKTQETAEGLLYYFVERKEKECFAAALFTCYELIRPDVVLELTWRFGLNDFAMPFMIQSFRQFSDKLSSVQAKLEAHDKALDEHKTKPGDNTTQDPNVLIFNPTLMPLALTAPQGMVGPFPGPTQYSTPYNPNQGFGL